LFISNREKLEHEIITSLLAKKLEKAGLTKGMERNKEVCLEEGICSLPSGRSGYPEEARRVAGLEDREEP
jgi:hypothetical protein